MTVTGPHPQASFHRHDFDVLFTLTPLATSSSTAPHFLRQTRSLWADVARMRDEARRFVEEEDARRRRIDVHTALEDYCFRCLQSLNDERCIAHHDIDSGDRAAIEGASNETLQWLDVNPNAQLEQYEAQQAWVVSSRHRSRKGSTELLPVLWRAAPLKLVPARTRVGALKFVATSQTVCCG